MVCNSASPNICKIKKGFRMFMSLTRLLSLNNMTWMVTWLDGCLVTQLSKRGDISFVLTNDVDILGVIMVEMIFNSYTWLPSIWLEHFIESLWLIFIALSLLLQGT